MSKFGFQYGAHASGQRSYLDYDRMKEYLHVHEEAEINALIAEPSVMSHNSTFSNVFFGEMDEVDRAFQKRLNVVHSYFDNFQVLADAYVADDTRDKRHKKVREANLKRNATQIYNKIAKLENFRLLNRTAAIKILKKYNKIALRHDLMSCYDVYMDRINKMQIGHGKGLIEVKDHLILLYAELFCDGELEEAHLKLSLSKKDDNLDVLQWVMLKVGVIVTLVLIIVHNCSILPELSMLFLIGGDPVVYVYAAVGALIAYRWFWGFSVYMWDKAGVDYVLALSLDPNKHMPTYADIYNDASTLSVLFLVNFQLFHLLRYYHTRHTGEGLGSYLIAVSEYAYVLPVALVAGTLARAIGSYAQPTSYGVFSTYISSRLVCTPFLKVFLRDNFAANILSSFTKVWSAMLYSGCYFGTGAFLHAVDPSSAEGIALFDQCVASKEIFGAKLALQLFPLVLRFLQCLRQRRDFLLLAASHPVTAAAAAVVEVEMSPAVDYSLEPRLEDALVLNFDVESALFGDENEAESGAGAGAEAEAGQGGQGGDRREGREDREDSAEQKVGECSHFGASNQREEETGVEMSAFAHAVSPAAAFSSAVKLSRTGECFAVSQCASWLVHILCNGAKKAWGVWKKLWIWPHSFNAFRYFLSIAVVFFGALPPQDPDGIVYMCWYVPLCIISTLYNCYWDVIVDYQLFQTDAEVPFLRKKLCFHKMKSFYYFVIVANPVLRFLWTLSFTPYGSHPFLVVFEIARRGFWAVLRMEVAYIQELKRRRAV